MLAELGSAPLDLEHLDQANAALLQFYRTFFFKGEAKPNVMDMQGPGLNVIKACSEALFFGVAACFKSEIPMSQAI